MRVQTQVIELYLLFLLVSVGIFLWLSGYRTSLNLAKRIGIAIAVFLLLAVSATKIFIDAASRMPEHARIISPERK